MVKTNCGLMHPDDDKHLEITHIESSSICETNVEAVCHGQLKTMVK